MDLLSSTWVTNHGLGSMRSEFDVVKTSTASKGRQLDDLSKRIERMRMDLRANEPAVPEPSRRRRRRRAGGTTAGADGEGGSTVAAPPPPAPAKAPSTMTATERVALELSQENTGLTETCAGCGGTFPRGRFAELHKSSCMVAARRRRKRTEQLGLLETPNCLSSCTICGYFFKNKDMDAHYRSCLRSKVSDKDLVDSLLPQQPPVVPRPPTDLTVAGVTCQTVDLTCKVMPTYPIPENNLP